MTRRDHRDIFGGLLMAAIGGAAVVLSQAYRIGSVNDMGPGYFPFILGILLSVLGLSLAVSGWFRSGTPIVVNWRGYGLVIGSLLFFGATLNSLGLLLATVGSVIISSSASGVLSLKGRGILVLCVVAVTYGVFALALGMRLPLWLNL